MDQILPTFLSFPTSTVGTVGFGTVQYAKGAAGI